MALYAGRSWKRDELVSLIGDPQQIAGARSFRYSDGKADGVHGIGVNTGGGLQFTVLPGRGMDIPEALFKGKALHFFSGTGITSPAYFEEPGLGWLRSFYVGLLTTCGITNSGAPSTDEGEPFGLHGRVANAAAEDLCIDQHWDGDEYTVSLRGKIRESKAMFENLALHRSIETRLGAQSFTLRDVIVNNGFEPQPLMMLYHFNFGFPLLSPGSHVIGPILETVPRDEEASKDRGVEECMGYPEPVQGYREKVFFHTLGSKKSGDTFISLVNPDCGDGTPLGIVLRFNKRELPVFTQWKMPRKGFYVTGLEPGTALPLGRGVLRERGELMFLQGQQEYTISIGVEVIDTEEQIGALRSEAEKLSADSPKT
jgi:hypothetical protein